jgi:hypothetical protein
MFNISDRNALTDLNDLSEKDLLKKTGITGRGIAYNLTRNKPELCSIVIANEQSE